MAKPLTRMLVLVQKTLEAVIFWILKLDYQGEIENTDPESVDSILKVWTHFFKTKEIFYKNLFKGLICYSAWLNFEGNFSARRNI